MVDKRKRETMATLTNGIEALRRKIDEQEEDIEKLTELLRDKKNATRISNTAGYQANLLYNTVSRAIGVLENANNDFIARKEAQKILILGIRKIDELHKPVLKTVEQQQTTQA